MDTLAERSQTRRYVHRAASILAPLAVIIAAVAGLGGATSLSRAQTAPVTLYGSETTVTPLRVNNNDQVLLRDQATQLPIVITNGVAITYAAPPGGGFSFPGAAFADDGSIGGTAYGTAYIWTGPSSGYLPVWAGNAGNPPQVLPNIFVADLQTSPGGLVGITRGPGRLSGSQYQFMGDDFFAQGFPTSDLGLVRINASGVMCGTLNLGSLGYRAIKVLANNTGVYLGPPSPPWSFASDVNNSGDVAGELSGQAHIWRADGTEVDLGGGRAVAINDSGVVAIRDCNQVWCSPAIWYNGVRTPLSAIIGPLGPGFNYYEPIDLSNNGLLLLTVQNNDGVHVASARISPVVGTPVLTAGCVGSSASVAVAATGFGPLMYQWQIGNPAAPGGWTNLDDGSLIIGGANTCATITGSRAPTVVIGLACTSGVDQVDGSQYRCIVTNACGSTTSDAATLTICAADFNCSGGLSVQDIFDFLAAYFGGDTRADFNASGAISVQDIFDFLAAYFAGCV